MYPDDMPGIEEQPLSCPYCGESISVLVDASAGAQDYIEDCEVCCRPMTISVSVDSDGVWISARHEDE
ncbi:MAG: CPXCG motif-containing cysteine-rich protein [Pseudomonadota bacterium]